MRAERAIDDLETRVRALESELQAAKVTAQTALEAHLTDICVEGKVKSGGDARAPGLDSPKGSRVPGSHDHVGHARGSEQSQPTSQPSSPQSAEELARGEGSSELFLVEIRAEARSLLEAQERKIWALRELLGI